MESCAICFQEPEKLNICSLEPCHHEFCKDCVLKLRAQKCRLKCPLCRCNVESAKTVRYLLFALLGVLVDLKSHRTKRDGAGGLNAQKF